MDNLQALADEATKPGENIQLLRDALVKKFSASDPLLQQRETALKDFLASPQEASEKYGQPQTINLGGEEVPNVHLSPSRQRSLYAREVANKFAPLQTINDLLMMRGGHLEGLLAQKNELIKGDRAAKQQKFSNALELEKLRVSAMPYGGLDIGSDMGEIDESLDERSRLQQMVLKLPPGSPYAKNIIDSWKARTGKPLFPDPNLTNAFKEIQKINSDILNKTGTRQALTVLAKQNFPLNLGKPFITKEEAVLSDLESKYFVLTQELMTSIQGSRPSDYDALSYQRSLGPSIANTPEVNKNRIATMMALAGEKSISNTNVGEGGIRAEEARTRLQATGKYTDQEIEEYIKKKGLL